MRTAVLIAVTALGILPVGLATAGCDQVWGSIFVTIRGCEYDSDVYLVCYNDQGSGYAYLEVVHNVATDWGEPLYWNHVWDFGSELIDYVIVFGWPRQPFCTTASFYAEDPEPPPGQPGVLLDQSHTECGCLEQCV